MTTPQGTTSPSSLVSRARNDDGSSSSAPIEIPPNLKFLLTSIRTLISTPLTSDNYIYWSTQISSLFSANGFSHFLDPDTTIPDLYTLNEGGQLTKNPSFDRWNLIDKNLRAALFSLISPSVLPHVLTLPNTAAIWMCLQSRFQSTNRSRVLQLKLALQQVSMKNSTVEIYLTEIKRLVDLLAASGSPTSPEDVILHTLQGLPPAYSGFQTAIRTRPGSLSLDEFYNLLSSEELHLARSSANQMTTDSVAYYTSSRSPNRGRTSSRGGRFNPNRGGRSRPTPSPGRANPPQSSYSGNNFNSPARSGPNVSTNEIITCQICSKPGHSARRCWYRGDYSNTPPPPKQAYQSSSPSYSNTSTLQILPTTGILTLGLLIV